MAQLYSFRGEEPKEIPQRIRLPGGYTKTDPATFSEQDLIDAGYTGPFEKPDYDPIRQELVWNKESVTYTVNDLPEELLPAQPTEEDHWRNLRGWRNGLLSGSDWIFVPDIDISEEKKGEWIAYRQLLRDLPKNIEDPTKVVWPEEPTL